MQSFGRHRQSRWQTGTVVAAAGRTVTVALPGQLGYVTARTIPFSDVHVGEVVTLGRLRQAWVCLGRAAQDAPQQHPAPAPA